MVWPNIVKMFMDLMWNFTDYSAWIFRNFTKDNYLWWLDHSLGDPLGHLFNSTKDNC